MSFIQNTEAYYTHKREAADFKRSKNVYDHEFLFDHEDLSYLMSHYQEEPIAISILAQMGGVEGIAYALRTDLAKGLGADELDEEDDGALKHRRGEYGSNFLSEKPPKSFWALCWDETEDPMLRVLIVAGIISIVTGAISHPEDGWTEGVAILFAVVIVVSVGAFNNWQKEKQFRKQEAESKKKDCLVLRAGVEKKIPFGEVVVGDLVILRSGFTIPADGIFVFGTDNLKTQEAGLTGESKELSKNRQHPLLMKGTNVVQGDGLMVAVAVGDRTSWGRLLAKLKEERSNTPLQDKLEYLGKQIGWGGMAVAIVLFLILLIKWIIEGADSPETNVIQFFIIAVTIVVVAVPEGLPLAVTISLAYSMKKMLKDNNFVRHLQACETMGNATTICSDKTGTLTTNRMSVSKCHLYGDTEYFDALPTRGDMSDKAYARISTAVCVNTKSFKDKVDSESAKQAIAEGKMKHPLTGGNQTDCAMLQWAIDLGITADQRAGSDFTQIRTDNPTTKFFPFDSKVKRSSVLVKDTLSEQGQQPRFAMYVKGAAEQILKLCAYRMTKEGDIEELSGENVEQIQAAMDTMTCTGLRCLGVCFRIYEQREIAFKSTVSYTLEDEAAEPLFAEMVWIGCTGIADPVRDEVPDAVATCQNAGIVVRMVTGDHLETARHIAKQCGILTCADHVCMTGGEFRELSDEDKKKLLPRLRVLARSKPADKEELVIWYRTMNEPKDIVAVTGDGANDALALKNADVGLSMGIQGTDVAKEASDIIIMDDNFASIEKTVMWGRSVYDNIRKFVQFQLTVNVTALTLSIVCAFGDGTQNPLTAVQLLWVNLIMDTMAALALATEQPTRALLNRNPFQKDSHLITQVLWRFVFGHSALQLAVLIAVTFAGDKMLTSLDGEEVDETTNRYEKRMTVVFNTFVWFQIFNEINARKVNDERNVFDGILSNSIFWFIIVVTVVLQVILVQVPGLSDFANTKPLDITEWAFCVGVGAFGIIWHQLVLCVKVNMQDGIQQVNKEVLFKREPEFAPGYQVKVQ